MLACRARGSALRQRMSREKEVFAARSRHAVLRRLMPSAATAE